MDNLTAPFVVRRMAGAIGAEIGGVKLRPDLPAAVIADLRSLWLEHLVLFFRNQELTPQELAAVARRFGEVVHYPFLKGLHEAPEVIQVAKLAASICFMPSDSRTNHSGTAVGADNFYRGRQGWTVTAIFFRGQAGNGCSA
jgi:alpha-ketoglutarate-dependent taurine dioxygenase